MKPPASLRRTRSHLRPAGCRMIGVGIIAVVSLASCHPTPNQVNLVVTLAPAAEPAVTDGPVSWTATIDNVGGITATGVQLTAPLPASVTGLTATTSGGTCTVASQVTCNLANLGSGNAITVVVSGTAPPQPQTLSLSTTATSTQTDAHSYDNQATAEITVEASGPNAVVVDDFARPDSWSMGTAPTGQPWEVWQGTARVAGEQALASEPGYTLSVIDAGTTTGAVEVSTPSISSDYWLIARASNTGNYWRFGRGAGGGYELQQIRDWALGSPPITVHGTVSPAAGDRLECRFLTGITCFVNGVAVASSTDPFNASAHHVGFAAYGASSAPAVRFDDFLATTPVPAPDLVVEVTATETSVESGQLMTWTATVRNDGPELATEVVLSATAPSGLGSLTTNTSVGSCTNANNLYTCSLGGLEPTAVATVTFDTYAPATIGTYTLLASASSDETDGDLSTNQDSSSISVRVLALPGEAVTDHFTRPDATTLGTAEEGRPWDMMAGTLGVVSNRAGKTDGGAGLSIAAIDPGFTFGTMEVTVPAGAASGFFVVFRARDTANYYRLGPDAEGNYRVQKILNGQVAGLQFNSIRANVQANDGDLIRLVLRPDDGWLVAINGVHVLDGGDVDLLDEFRFGLAAASPTVRFDDVSITQGLTTGIETTEAFNHPAESNLELRTPTSGTVYPWLTPVGYWVTRDGAGTLDSPGFGLASLYTSSHLARVRGTVRTASSEAWLVFRRSSDGAHYRFGRTAGGTYTFIRVGSDGQALPIPGGVDVVQSVSAGTNDGLDIRQWANGDVEGYVNGVLVASFTDAVNGLSATSYGIAGVFGVTFDDLIVTPP